MARGKKTTVLQVELPENTDATEAGTEETTEADKVIQEDQSENPRSPFKVVERIDPFGGDPAWLGKFPIQIVSREWLAKRFGGGEYRVTTRKPKPTGGYQYVQQQTIKIDASIKPEPGPEVHTGNPPMNPDGIRGGTLGETLLLSMMKAQSDSAAQSMQMMQGLFTALTGAFTALKPAAPVADPMMTLVLQGLMDRKDPMELATTMLEKVGTGKDPLEMLTRLLELQKLLPSAPEADDQSPLSLVGKGIDALRAGFEASRAQLPPRAATIPPVPQPPAPPPPPPIPAPIQPAAALPAPEIDPNMRKWKRTLIGNLPLLLGASAYMPAQAAAITAQTNLEADGLWADLVKDVRSDYPVLNLDAELPEDFGSKFVERAMNDFGLASAPPDVKEWAEETLEELAVLAVTPVDEEPEPSAEPEPEKPV